MIFFALRVGDIEMGDIIYEMDPAAAVSWDIGFLPVPFADP